MASASAPAALREIKLTDFSQSVSGESKTEVYPLRNSKEDHILHQEGDIARRKSPRTRTRTRTRTSFQFQI